MKVVQVLLFCLMVSALSVQGAVETNTVSVLAIGNSFSNNARSLLRKITESVPGCKVVIGSADIGGCYLEKHAKLIKDSETLGVKPYRGKTLKELLTSREWDVVTIQQVSHKSFKWDSYQPYADEIVAYIKTNAPTAEIVIHQTWAYAPNCKRLDGWNMKYEDMHAGVTNCYYKLSEYYGGMRILKSGEAMYESHKKNPDIDLWNKNDRFHANKNGCYLTGCVWFGELFGISPEKVTWKPGGMSEDVAKKLRAAAASVID